MRYELEAIKEKRHRDREEENYARRSNLLVFATCYSCSLLEYSACFDGLQASLAIGRLIELLRLLEGSCHLSFGSSFARRSQVAQLGADGSLLSALGLVSGGVAGCHVGAAGSVVQAKVATLVRSVSLLIRLVYGLAALVVRQRVGRFVKVL